ncbi:MAG: VWA domain-containing protein [Candidatus Latescibacterota bacterium]|nr:VWA domain-containing protein [Candidatus Latescibacterota bacterium]
MGLVRFSDPLWLLLLAAIPVIVYRYVLAARTRGTLRFSHSLHLRVAPSAWTRLRHFVFAAKMVGLACLILAMARPQSGEQALDVSAEGVDIMLLLDVSGSMKVKDLGPDNRLEVAKQVVSEFIAGRHSDRIGLIVFAGESFTQCPLTLDYDVLLQFLDEIRIAEEEWDGTAIGMAIINACNRLRESEAESKVAILLTDGVNNAGEIDPATASDVATAIDVRIYAIGIGASREGPMVHAGRRRTHTVDFDEETLRLVADRTGGQYYHATSQEKLAQIYEEIGSLETTEIRSQVHVEYMERYSAFLWPGFALLLLEFLIAHTRLRRLP